MSYKYHEHRSRIFTDDGQQMFICIRDQAKDLMAKAGAFRWDKLHFTGDNWLAIACVDRMVELGEIKELTQPGSVMGQHRIFTSTTP